MIKYRSNNAYIPTLSNNIYHSLDFLTTHYLWAKSIRTGKTMRKIIIYGNKFKKIHVELNQTYHFFRKRLLPFWFHLLIVLANRDIKWSMVKGLRWLSTGWPIKNNSVRHTVTTIWLESYLFMRNWILKQPMYREWTKCSHLFFILLIVGRNN